MSKSVKPMVLLYLQLDISSNEKFHSFLLSPFHDNVPRIKPRKIYPKGTTNEKIRKKDKNQI